MSESSATKRVKALIQLGCKLLVNTRNLKEIEADITFLEKVTTTEITALRKLQRKQQGDHDDVIEEDSWDDIRDEVQVVLDNEMITWPPTQASTTTTLSKRPLESGETDGPNEKDIQPDKRPNKKSKRNGGKGSGRKKGSKHDSANGDDDSGNKDDAPQPI